MSPCAWAVGIWSCALSAAFCWRSDDCSAQSRRGTGLRGDGQCGYRLMGRRESFGEDYGRHRATWGKALPSAALRVSPRCLPFCHAESVALNAEAPSTRTAEGLRSRSMLIPSIGGGFSVFAVQEQEHRSPVGCLGNREPTTAITDPAEREKRLHNPNL